MKRRKTFSEINITPLTDIFLVLLIIMMVVTPMLDYKGLNLAVLSSGDAAQSDEKPKTMMVEVNLLGEYTVAGAPVPRDRLAEAFKERSVDFPDGVLVEIDPETTHEALTYVIAAAEQAGITRLALSEKKEKPREVVPPKASNLSRRPTGR